MSDLIRTGQPTGPVRYIQREEQEPEIWFDQYSDEEPDLLRYWRILWRRKYLVVAVTFTVVVAAAVITFTMTPLYRASVKIQIDPEAKFLSYQLQDNSFASSTSLETQVTVLKSRTLRRLIGESLQNSGKLTSPLISADLKVSVIPNTQIIKVDYTSEDPKFAATVVNTLAVEYIEYNFTSKYESVTQARDFLAGEIQELKINLERSEENLGEYSKEHGILNMATGENLVVQKLVDLTRQLTQLEGQLLANRYENVKDMTVENLPAGMKTKKMVDLEMQISAFDLQLASLTSQFGPKWPEVKKLEDQLSAAREQLVQATRQAIEQERIQYELFSEHSNRLIRAVDRQEELVSELRESLIQYNILLREVDSDKELYDGLLQRIKEAGISAGLRSSNVRVIEPGTVPLFPYVPNTPFHLALGLALGLMLACPLALLLEFLDKTLKTSEDVEGLGLPCLSVIPALDSSIVGRGRELLAEPNGGSKATKIVPYLRNMPPMCWESYRSLRTSLLLSSAGKPPQSILISSALPSEGKSTTTVNLGISYAQTGARVLIMELDLRRPRLAERLSVQPGLGMSTYLSGNSELASEIRPTNIPNLFLIQGGPIPPNPPELIGSERMQLAFRLLSKHFDFLLVDAPPILSVTDSVVVSTSVDGVVLVIEGGKTPRDAVSRAQNRLVSVGATILGAIINKVEMNAAGYEYDIRYDYGDYYSAADDA